MPITMWEWVALLFVGLLAGFSGGLLGIGGSVVMIPCLTVMLGPRQHLYQASAMIVNFFIVAPAVVRHLRAGATQGALLRWMIPCAIVGALGGVLVSELPLFRGTGQGFLQIGFAAFLGYVIVQNLSRLIQGKREPGVPGEAPLQSLAARTRLIAGGLIGLPTGLMAGILGVGGGLYAVPAQQVLLRTRLPSAIANSSATILWSSVVGAVLKNSQLGNHGLRFADSFLLAICLIPTAMIGSYFAAGRVHRWPISAIRVAFIVLLVYCGWELLITGLNQVAAS